MIHAAMFFFFRMHLQVTDDLFALHPPPPLLPPPSLSSGEHLQELSDIAPVHTHGGHFGAAMLVELVAARLATETVQEKLLANIAERQFQIRLPDLKQKKERKIHKMLL